MTDQQHTPGPWEAKVPGTIVAHSDKCVVRGEDSVIDWVATVQVSNMPAWRANAHLIAAAPELLEALRGIVDSFETCPENLHSELFTAARAAIAKAEGRE